MSNSDKILRCAIYTRKSTEEGLDQEFNTLQAQRESAEAYIRSQRLSGWIALQEVYDDGGFSGASLERPALDRLLHAIEAGQVDCVIVGPSRPVDPTIRASNRAKLIGPSSRSTWTRATWRGSSGGLGSPINYRIKT